jgi:IclR family transcriptional regulator, acetate operon repressor
LVLSVLKAIDIIALFSPDSPRLNLTEICNRLDIPKSTAHNLLNTLLSRGFIEKVESEQYALGMEFIARTQAVRVNVELRDRAAQLLRELADTAHESVYLTAVDGNLCLYIFAIESHGRLIARTAVGERVPMHCTAVGKAILGHMDPKEAAGIVKAVGLPAYTKATITSLASLQKDLALIRQRGFALDNGEHEEGTYCIGAPIFNERNLPIGSCSVSGCDPDLLAGGLKEASALVMHTAQEISRRMGYVPSTRSWVATELSIRERGKQ